FQGLFGHTSNAIIENLGLENGSIAGSSYTGSLAGVISNSTVTDCYNTGNVNGLGETGGLIGRVYISTVNNSHASGNVSGSNYVGGLVGQNYENSLIKNSYATGQVNASPFRGGGLVGSNIESTVDSCYAWGNVNGWHYIGGLVGDNNLGMISNSYATGTVSGSEYVGGLVGTLWKAHVSKSYATGNIAVSGNRAGGLVGSTYNISSISNSYSLGNLTRTSGNDTIFGAFIGYSHPSLTITNCYTIGSVFYDNDDDPTDKGFSGLHDGTEVISSFWDSQVSNQSTAYGGQGKTTQDMKIKYFYTQVGWDFTGETTNGEEDIWEIASNGQTSYPFLSAWVPDTLPGLEDVVFAGGDGSPENPYQVENLTHLKNTRYYLDAWYIQTADIDASETSNWDDGNSGEPEGWLTIGYYYNRFTGSYNGKNHVITGLTINRPGTGYQGLFGYVEGAIIDSLGLEDCNISGMWHVGALAGYAYNNSVISNCYSTGTVTGYQEGGGLLGDIEYSELKQSFSTANVFVIRSNAGGLIGLANNGSLIKDCYARGNVTKTGIESLTHFGAFSGASSTATIENCYATGSVFYENGDDPVANGFVVYDFNNTFTGNFWDSEASNQNSATGATAQTTANMKPQSTFTDAGWDFMMETANGTDDHWGINDEDNDGYPFLKFQGYKLNTEVTEWPVAGSLDCGQTLGESTLTGGNASVEGTFAFTNPDEVPVFGTFDYEVAFHPTDPENYATIYGSVSVTVEDNMDPEIISTHPDQTLDADNDCQAILPDYTADVVANDNCDENLTIYQTPEPGTLIAGDVNTVTLTVVDHASNTAEVFFNVIVADNTDPEITSTHPDQTLETNDNCEAILPDYTNDVVAFDNCTEVLTISQDPQPGFIVSVDDIISVTLTAGDEAGNFAEVSFDVGVEDTMDPTISCLDDQTVDANSDETYVVSGTEFDPVSVDDNCTISSIINDFNSQSTLDGEVFPLGNTTVTWTATDGNGNEASCSFDVMVNSDTGVNTMDDYSVKIFPNPVNEILTIEFAEYISSDEILISITDISGRSILTLFETLLHGRIQINTTSLEKGAYFITLKFDEGSFTRILIKE
ncbi:MAG: GLUG motif-containing protein, partial [Bacteroidales bacterium]